MHHPARSPLALTLLFAVCMLMCACRTMDEDADVLVFDGSGLQTAHAHIFQYRIAIMNGTHASLTSLAGRTIFRGKVSIHSPSVFLRPQVEMGASRWQSPESGIWKLLCIDPPCFVQIKVNAGKHSPYTAHLGDLHRLTKDDRLTFWFDSALYYSFLTASELNCQVTSVRMRKDSANDDFQTFLVSQLIDNVHHVTVSELLSHSDFAQQLETRRSN